jgi:hypothetical protein
MECGFLNARCRKRDALLREYGLWCWRMGLPMIWFEARSPRSRLNRLHLDLFTTPGCLSTRGHAELIGLSARHVAARHASVTAHGGVWDRVGAEDVEEFARGIFRTVRRKGNYEVHARESTASGGRVIEFPAARRA